MLSGDLLVELLHICFDLEAVTGNTSQTVNRHLVLATGGMMQGISPQSSLLTGVSPLPAAMYQPFSQTQSHKHAPESNFLGSTVWRKKR